MHKIRGGINVQRGVRVDVERLLVDAFCKASKQGVRQDKTKEVEALRRVVNVFAIQHFVDNDISGAGNILEKLKKKNMHSHALKSVARLVGVEVDKCKRKGVELSDEVLREIIFDLKNKGCDIYPCMEEV